MQTGPTGWAAWQASIKEVHPNVGLSPASVMLSAYGFYDGTERDKDGHTRSGGSHALQQYPEHNWCGRREQKHTHWYMVAEGAHDQVGLEAAAAWSQGCQICCMAAVLLDWAAVQNQPEYALQLQVLNEGQHVAPSFQYL